MNAFPSVPQNRLLGILLRLGAMACLGIMAAMIKLAHEAQIHIVEQIFYRFAFGLPPLAIWIAVTRNFRPWHTQRPLAHLARGALGITTMALGFGALAYLPLAEAAVIGFAAPFFSVVLSALILSEPVGRHRWSAVAIGFLGVLIVMQPGDTALPTMGLVLALLNAFSVAVVMVTIRQIGRTDSTPTSVLWFSGFSLIASGLLMPAFATRHDLAEWLILLVLGLAGGLGQLLTTASLRFAPVSAVVPFDYTQLLWAVLLGWVIWQTQPSATTWAGAAVIIASGLYTLYREHKLGREKPPPDTF